MKSTEKLKNASILSSHEKAISLLAESTIIDYILKLTTGFIALCVVTIRELSNAVRRK